jgi:hypothetical protein
MSAPAGRTATVTPTRYAPILMAAPHTGWLRRFGPMAASDGIEASGRSLSNNPAAEVPIT